MLITYIKEKMEDKTEITDKKQNKPWLFKKGQSGNPDGRPVGSVSIVEGIRKKLLEIEPENKKTYLDLFLSRYFRKAIKDGDVGLIRDMINRIDGMPMQKNDLTTNGKDLPTPILNAVYNNNSDKEADTTKETD